MKINFILPFTSHTGGIKIAFEYANRLTKKGHDVRCYIPMVAYKFSNRGLKGTIIRIKDSLRNTLKNRTNIEWFNAKFNIKLVPYISNMYIRNADVVIATAWPTAYSVYRLNENKGRKYYLIQHYEIWSGDPKLVNESYKLKLKHIVIAKWIKDIMVNKFNSKSCELIHNGIDFNEFSCNYKSINKNKVICMLYHQLEWKGFKDGLSAFEMIRRKYPDIKLILFGTTKSDDIPEYVEFYLRPSVSELRDIYCRSDIFIFPSKNEGWGLTIIEAMACKCAIVATRTGAVNEIGINNYNMLISEPSDIKGLAKNIDLLINSDDLIKKISLNAYKTALNFDWDKSIDKFEAVIKD